MAKKTSDSVDSIIAAANAAAPVHKYVGPGVPSIGVPSGQAAGQSRPRNATAGDPAVQAAPSRAQTERMGASYRVSAGLYKPVDPAATRTMDNVRVLPPATVRSGFDGR